MKELCLIIGAADSTSNLSYLADYTEKDPYIYCADGGYLTAIVAGLIPDQIIGDFDSLHRSKSELTAELPDSSEITALSPIKDDTDLFACIDHALEKGFHKFLLANCTGGRLDHFMGAVSALEYLHEHGADGLLLDPQNEIRFVSGPVSCSIPEQSSYPYFSVIPLDRQLSTISIAGAKYPLEHYTMKRAGCIGISNEVEEHSALINIEDGAALIIRSREKAGKRG